VTNHRESHEGWLYVSDTRPAKGNWAPGKYMCRCIKCGKTFAGDKRAGSCADCAYSNEKDSTHE
jgi:hypothetical protein